MPNKKINKKINNKKKVKAKKVVRHDIPISREIMLFADMVDSEYNKNCVEYVYSNNPLDFYAPDLYLDNDNEIPTDNIYESNSDSDSF